MTQITIIVGKNAAHQKSHGVAMAKGLRKLGIGFYVTTSKSSRIKTKMVACWGWRFGSLLRQLGHDVLVMERGYVGDRFRYTSLGWNGLNGYAAFPEYPDDAGARFKRHGGVLKPWKEGGDYGLILGQVPGDMSLKGKSLAPFYAETAEKIRNQAGLAAQFRPHPEAVRKGFIQDVPGAEKSTGTLDQALQGAAFTVCYNSNSSVDSVLAGVPCIVADRGSMAWEVCGHEIGELRRPERREWAYRLAFRQWTLDEIGDGIPLKKLFEERPC